MLSVKLGRLNTRNKPPIFASSKRKKWVKGLPKRFSSSVMLLETLDGRLLTVKSNYKAYWSLPGGIIDPSETPRETAMRETNEEVGITVKAHEVSFVAVIDRKSEVAETYQFIFKAPLTDEMSKRITLQASEIDEYEFVTKQQVLSRDRPYAKALAHWANGTIGYIEQTFEGGSNVRRNKG